MNLTMRLTNFLYLNGCTSKNQSFLRMFYSISTTNLFNDSIRNLNVKPNRCFASQSSSKKLQVSQQNKRLIKKKKVSDQLESGYCVTAYSTAEEYNLESLVQALPKFTKFQPTTFGAEYGNLTDFLHAELNNSTESKHLFFFREGSVVMWNTPLNEVSEVLDCLKYHEENSFDSEMIEAESEMMPYSYSPDVNQTKIVKDSVLFSSKGDFKLEKYAISNAMALSVTLGTFESNLEKYIEAMGPVTEDLKSGVEIKMTREEVLRKMGQLFALRHKITLSSDLLDTPDFYWDQEELEKLYQSTFNYFCISKRTKVINEKLNHCIELVQLLSSHLSDKHHVRLEWMIIVLIMVEVAFEIVHYVDRYIESKENANVYAPS